MLILKNVSKTASENKDVFLLKDINLDFESNGLNIILGPSGSGKSTLLNMIGGIDTFSSGDILFLDQSIKEFNNKEWDKYRLNEVGFVFQSYNLISHLNVYDNVDIALKNTRLSKKEHKNAVKNVLKAVSLEGFENKKITKLSGGEQQKVAIARALIKNPSIILADEPTGALDQENSEIIMGILKEISKEKLVILITHNDKLAYKYADRIIEFSDGKVVNVNTINQKEDVKKENIHINSRSIGFSNSMKISLKNVFSKKVRSILTTLGSSFGIIGLALVLALSNGVNKYATKVELEASTLLPITINSMSSKPIDNDNNLIEFPDEDLIYSNDDNGVSSSYRINFINEKYLNYLSHIKEKYDYIDDFYINIQNANTINFLTDFTDGSVNFVDNSLTFSTSSTNFISQIIYSSNSAIHPLFGGENYLKESYDLIYGEYPNFSSSLDAVLVLDQYNSLPTKMLEILGFLNTTSENKTINFEDVLNKKIKVVNHNELYRIEKKGDVYSQNGFAREIYTSKTSDLNTLLRDENSGKELNIVGVVRPKENTIIGSLGTGICYVPTLNSLIVEENQNSDILKQSTKNFSLKRYVDGKDFQDEIIALSNTINVDEILNNLEESAYLIERLNRIFDKYFDFYSIFNGNILLNGISDYIKELSLFGSYVDPFEVFETGIPESIQKVFDYYNNGDYVEFYDQFILLACCLNNYSQIKSIYIYPKDFDSKNEILNLLDKYNEISNDKNDPYHANNDQERVYYTDVVSDVGGPIMELTSIITLILVIFSSISLIVSCFLMGIITYSSVIERTKEIGILRSLGMKKGDVGGLFIYESMFISLIAAILGLLISIGLSYPLNYFINNFYSQYALGQLVVFSSWHFIVLILISLFIGLVAGFVPSLIASRKKIVECLRSE